VPLTEIPVFARAGTIVPTYPDGVQTLVRESTTVAGAASVGDDRVVYVFAGANGSFQEAPPDMPGAGTLSYTLASAGPTPAGSASATWNGAPLAACTGAAPTSCVVASADGVTAHVTGPGSLAVTRAGAPAATFTASGGASTRALTIVVRM
jgi:hypothetical protein